MIPTIFPSTWIRGPWFDTAFLAFPWLPVFAFFMISNPVKGFENRDLLFTLVLFLISAFEFTHRKYTYFVAFGDREIFRRRPRDFIATPIIIFTLVSIFYLALPESLRPIGLTIAALWNIWHVLMQRYGMLRIYAS